MLALEVSLFREMCCDDGLSFLLVPRTAGVRGSTQRIFALGWRRLLRLLGIFTTAATFAEHGFFLT